MSQPTNSEKQNADETDETELEQGATPPEDETDEQQGDAGADQLGDAGKKALDAMKAKWRAERDKAKQLAQQLADATKKTTEDETPDLDAIRNQARDEARNEALKDKALDKLEAKAARLFQNPEDARAFLADKVDEFIDDGKVDVEAITDALDDLLKQRPYLGITQGETRRFQGTGDGGPKGSAGKPQLTKAEVERLYKEGKTAEIDKAREDGRLNTLLGIT